MELWGAILKLVGDILKPRGTTLKLRGAILKLRGAIWQQSCTRTVPNRGLKVPEMMFLQISTGKSQKNKN